MILVFDFGFGEGGAVLHAPMDGFEALVDVAVGEEIDEGLGDDGLVFGAHREVGIFPAAEDAEALEFAAVDIDELGGVGAAGGADVGDGHGGLALAEFGVDLQFDGQAVAVPAGDVGGVEAGHGLGLDDEVLQDLVECGAEVDVAVGVGRAVVKDELGAAGAGFADAAVEVRLLPALENFGLVGGEVRLHGEIVRRQVDRLLQVNGGSIHGCVLSS